MVQQAYDPQKRHDYYERNKKLKGRQAGSGHPQGSHASKPKPRPAEKSASAKARIGRLRGKIAKLKGALAEVEAKLSEKRQSSRKTAKKNSDGKTTAKERQSSQKYRDKHQTELAAKEKKKSGSSSGGSSSSSKAVSEMGVDELEARASKIKSLIRDAQRQLSNANQELGQLAHSALLSDPLVKEHFAHFQSAERTPSK